MSVVSLIENARYKVVGNILGFDRIDQVLVCISRGRFEQNKAQAFPFELYPNAMFFATRLSSFCTYGLNVKKHIWKNVICEKHFLGHEEIAEE